GYPLVFFRFLPAEFRADHDPVADQGFPALVILSREFSRQKSSPLLLDGLFPTFQVPYQVAVQIDNFHSVDRHRYSSSFNETIWLRSFRLAPDLKSRSSPTPAKYLHLPAGPIEFRQFLDCAAS